MALMAGTLYQNPLFASGLAGLVDDFMGGNPREAAAAELYAAQAANENDTRRYRQGIVSTGQGGDLAGMLAQALAGGYGKEAPGIVSSMASLPGSGISPAAADRITVGTGTNTAAGTFTGLGITEAGDTARNNADNTTLRANNTDDNARAIRERLLMERGLDTRNDADNVTLRSNNTQDNLAGIYMNDVDNAGLDRREVFKAGNERAAADRGFDVFKDSISGALKGGALSTEATDAVSRLLAKTGPLNIISGRRSPEHNAKVGGAKHSEHINGNAIDIDTTGMSEEQRREVIRLAREEGLVGVGVYDNSLHFDVGAPRAWGPDYTRGSLPSEYADDVDGPVDSVLDPAAMDLLVASGTPGLSTTQSGVMGDIADLLMDEDDPEEGDNVLSAGGRTAALKALMGTTDNPGEVPDPAQAMKVIAEVDRLMQQGMSENDALAYALDPTNLRRAPGTPASESILPFGWGDEEAVPGVVEGLNLPGAGVGNPAAVGVDDAAAALQEARDAIAAGAPREAVIAELRRMGYDPAGL
jgi:hypothetical protein